MTEVLSSGPILSSRAKLPAAGARRKVSVPSAFWFWSVLVFLVLEYARIPGVVQLRLQFLIVLALPIAWFLAREKPFTPLLGAQLCFLLLCAAAVPFAWNYYAAYFTTRVMFGNLSIAFGMAWLFSYRPYFVRGVWVWCAIMAYIALFSLLHGGRGPGGFLGDENDLALACVTALGFAFFGIEQFPGRKRWACAALGVLLTVAVVKSFSRGGFVGLVAVGVYCFAVSRHKLRNSLVLLVSVVAFLLFASSEYIEEIKTITDTKEGTAQGRRFLWTTATNMWLDHPVLGVGGNNFQYLAGRYQPRNDPRFQTPEYLERDWGGTVTHSAYFQALAEQGLVGIALIGFIGFTHFRTLRRLRRDVRHAGRIPSELKRDAELYTNALGATMVGYAVSGLFVSVAYYPYFWYFSALSIALDAALRRELRSARMAQPS